LFLKIGYVVRNCITPHCKEIALHNNNVQDAMVHQLKKNTTWYLMLGIGLVILGMLAVIFAFSSTIFSVIYLGVFLVVIGFFEIVKAFKINRWGHFLLHLILGILYMMAGVYIVMYPAENAIGLTLFLAILLIVAGILRIVFALVRTVPHKGWLIVNGVLTLILGLLIWRQWPMSGLWVIGMFVGIDAMITGWTWIMVALAAKQLVKNYGRDYSGNQHDQFMQR